MIKKIQVTPEGFEKLKKEYDELSSMKKPTAIERLQKARAMGDLSENSEYTAAKEDLAFVEGRIKELEEVIKNAEVVEHHTSQNTVEIGCKVMIDMNGKTEEYMIVGEFEADPMARKLSHTSPIGKAIVGKKKGDTVEVEIPAGRVTYKIVDVKAA